MPYCRDCIYFHYDSSKLLFKYRCSLTDESVSETGCCNRFVARPTKSNTNYSSGSSSSGCFLTSACVDYLGKADDCKELTLLRKYRDEQMKKLPDGDTLIKEYYDVAPKIVDRIDASSEKSKYYDKIYSVISTCAYLIEKEEYEEVLSLYKNMVLDLKNEFNL